MNSLTTTAAQARTIRESGRYSDWEPIAWVPLRKTDKLKYADICAGHYCTGHPETGFVLYSRKGTSCWHQVTEKLFSPVLPGQVVAVKEPWQTRSIFHEGNPADEDDEGEMQVYAAFEATPRRGMRIQPDCTPVTFLHETTPLTEDSWLIGPYFPPETMPDDLVRTHLRCLSIQAERNETGEWGWRRQWEVVDGKQEPG